MSRASCTYVLCALAVAATPLRVAAAAPQVVDISVADTFDAEERKLLQQWMQDAAKQGMQSAKVSESEAGPRRLVIELTGAAPDYHLLIGVRAGKSWVEKRESRCACGDDELFERAKADVAAVAPSLRATARAAEPGDPTPAPVPAPASTPSSDLQPQRKSLSAKGIAGAVLVPVGVGVLGAGVWMAVAGNKRVVDDDERATETNYRPGGIGLAVAGGALLAAGVALLVVDVRRRNRGGRQATLVPMRNGFAVIGRF
jgi:hypothetical protein